MVANRWLSSMAVALALCGGVQAQVCQTDSIAATTPDTQLLDNGDGTVSDGKSGLMWKQCSEGQSGSDCAVGSTTGFSWQGVLQQAQTVNASGFAGYSDWRVPTIKELSSLVEWQCVEPAINLTRFPNTPNSDYWSSTATAVGSRYTSYMHQVNFRDGQFWMEFFIFQDSLRLVRGGQ